MGKMSYIRRLGKTWRRALQFEVSYRAREVLTCGSLLEAAGGGQGRSAPAVKTSHVRYHAAARTQPCQTLSRSVRTRGTEGSALAVRAGTDKGAGFILAQIGLTADDVALV